MVKETTCDQGYDNGKYCVTLKKTPKLYNVIEECVIYTIALFLIFYYILGFRETFLLSNLIIRISFSTLT